MTLSKLFPTPVRAVGLKDVTLTLTGKTNVNVNETARGGLLRSSGDNIAIGLERVKSTGFGPVSLNVNVNLSQCLRANSLTAIGIKDSELFLSDNDDSGVIRASVHASGARATAIALDNIRLVFDGGDDVAEIRADITGCWSNGSRAIALRDSNVALDDNGDLTGAPDRIVIAATGPNALWGQRSGVRGWGGNDDMWFDGGAEDCIINGFGGNDKVSLNNFIISTRDVAPPGEQRFGRIAGGSGFDTLEFRHISGKQFQQMITPFNDGVDSGFTLPGGARYVEWERVIAGGQVFDVTGVGL